LTRVGVVDVGTNSVRLLVADGNARTFADVARDLVITRLGEGVDRDRRLGIEPLRRTVDAIAAYVQRARADHAEIVRIIATSAVRDAENREDFMDSVRRATGLEPMLLSGDQEARSGFLGATMDISAPGPYLVVDIGGGSTELVLGRAHAETFISIDIGSVRLTERHVHSDPPSDDELAAVAKDADEHLEDAWNVLGQRAAPTMVGLAGTITTVAAIALNLSVYDRQAIHHSVLTASKIAEIRRTLETMSSERRKALPAMPKGREDVIVAGVVILQRVMHRFGFDECLVSESDILDGVALDVLRAR
jgi:exopolyphosphatase/guanosine-5'-triphosphate,3'-diphosphate pyrophosphatase